LKTVTSIAENHQRVVDQIQRFSQQYGRNTAAVTLLCVSKTQAAEAIMEAWQAGARDFGENYVQEALSKMQSLQLPDLRWHFIGPLQSNKTREVASHFHWVHSVDREKIARRLSEQRPDGQPPLNVCVQVNISGETSKSGIDLAQSEDLCRLIDSLPGLRLRGLMAIPAPSESLSQQRAVYRPLATQFRLLCQQFEHMDTLSIGMSDDLEAAIAEGATLVRVGTAIFGPRRSPPAS